MCVYSQVSVVRGKVMAGDGSPLIGVRVSVVTQPLYGFTLTRELGLYVLLRYLYETIHSLTRGNQKFAGEAKQGDLVKGRL